MLKECWQWWRASADREQRRLGYVSEAVAIRARYERCRDAWHDHLSASKQFIITALEHCSSRRSVLVLGAGSCLDLPLAELSRQFERVILVDAVQLAEIPEKISAYPNVTYVIHDISEINAGLLAITDPDTLRRLTSKTPSRYCDDDSIDLVISLNLLSQLPLLPMRWLRQRRSFNNDVINQCGLDIMRAHCRYLQQFGCAKILIYDAEQKTMNAQGHCTDRLLLSQWLHNEMGSVAPRQQQDWQWQLAPAGENGQTSTLHHVQALLFAP